MKSAVSEYHKSKDRGKPTFILDDLKDAPIWVAWRENSDGRKLPVNPATGRAAKSDSPDTWGSWKAAHQCAQGHRNGRPAGLGIMFTSLPHAPQSVNPFHVQRSKMGPKPFSRRFNPPVSL